MNPTVEVPPPAASFMRRAGDTLAFYSLLAALLAVPIGAIWYSALVARHQAQGARDCAAVALAQARNSRGQSLPLTAYAVGRLWHLDEQAGPGYQCTVQIDDPQERLSFIYLTTTGPGWNVATLDATYPLGRAPRFL
ncbi:hypothetical protein [Paraburkholderia youngii]|uniref:hypothetical protein n=1 Tax=Paraburkholderia youngii TaxID=2782701 RepID=UPI003D23D90F